LVLWPIWVFTLFDCWYGGGVIYVLSLECGEFQTFLKFGPLVWNLGDDLVSFCSSIEGVVVRQFACFSSHGTLTGCLHCSLVLATMPSRQRAVSRRGDAGNVRVKRCWPFSFDLVAPLFDFAPLEVRREISLLELKESGDPSYHSNTKVVCEGLKCVIDPGIFQKMRLHFLHSLSLHQQIYTLLCSVFKDKQVDNYNVFSRLEDTKCILRNLIYNL